MWALVDEVLDPILGVVSLAGLVWTIAMVVGIRRDIKKERNGG